jgi:rSAM/selenodomain-associated transferase 2
MRRADAPSASIALVIPCWNDAEALRGLLATLQGLGGWHEVLVAAVGEISHCRPPTADVRFVHCPQPNRGAQMNAGARLATSDALLFHHADTELTQPHLDALAVALTDRETIGGAFHRKYDGRHRGFAWIEPLARAWNARGGTLYGDQSIFVRRDAFTQLGGFPEIPLMEDVEFSRRLRRAGRTVLLDPPIATSARHHRRRGPWRTTARNATMLLLHRCGVCPHRLHRWYYRGFSGSENGAPES